MHSLYCQAINLAFRRLFFIACIHCTASALAPYRANRVVIKQKKSTSTVTYASIEERLDQVQAPVSSEINHESATPILSSASRESLKIWGAKPDGLEKLGAYALNENPPLLRLPNFLTEEECDFMIWLARDHGVEATEYLNARVNQENTENGSDCLAPSISSFGYTEEQTASAAAWSGGAKSGLRRRVPLESIFFIEARVLTALGLEQRALRDATVVHYHPGEGVAPHVDGNDATLLCYLNSLPEHGGGCTVFPNDEIKSVPSRGDALLYASKERLLHYAEPVGPGNEKWVLQLLLDFHVPADETGCLDYGGGDAVAR